MLDLLPEHLRFLQFTLSLEKFFARRVGGFDGVATPLTPGLLRCGASLQGDGQLLFAFIEEGRFAA